MTSVCLELKRYSNDIAALSEARFSEEGQFTENGAVYTIFWHRRPAGERREAGVSFAIKNDLVKKFASFPQGISDQIMTLKLLIARGKTATIISMCAPTLTNAEYIKAKLFAKEWEAFLFGDFIACVGKDHRTWALVIGNHGIGKCNSTGGLLLQFCSEHQLLITNAVFRHLECILDHATGIWLTMSPPTFRTDRQDMKVTKSLCGTKFWTDDRLIISKQKLSVKAKHCPQGKKMPKHINTNKRNRKACQWHPYFWWHWEELVFLPSNHLHHLQENQQKRHQHWFDENDEEMETLLEEKH